MFDDFVANNNLPSYRENQLADFYYKKYKTIADEYFVLPKNLRKLLKAEVELMPLEPVGTFASKDQNTHKVLFRTSKNIFIETVLMKHRSGKLRNTVCVSCMSGCPVGCVFCATGKMGFHGNLFADEIVAQVLYFARWLCEHNEGAVDNVVFMGMGEPLLNFKNVWKAYEILTDSSKFALGKRRVTISTSGFIDNIKKLIDLKYRGRLAVSLHAPNQKLRERLMANAAIGNPLVDLFEVLDQFVELTNKRITYEYILIKNLTDTKECLEELILLLSGRLVHVNLIAYNPIKTVGFERPSIDRVRSFERELKDAGIPVSIRATMGDDIGAACGQLAVQEKLL